MSSSTPATSIARSARLGLRATPSQEAILRRAAEISHKSLTEVILDSACQTAEQTLLEQRLFMAPDSRYQAPALLGADHRLEGFDCGRPSLDEEAARFYTRFGFIASPVRDRQLLLLLKDAKRILTRDS